MKKTSYLLLIYILTISLIRCEYDANTNRDDEESLLIDSMALLYQRNEIDKSIKLGEKFIIDYPRNDVGWSSLSSAYLAKGDDSIATKYSLNALIINPNNNVALCNYGILLDKKKKYEEAANYYERSLKSNNQIAQTYSNYALNRLMAGDFEKAVELGENAVILANNIKDKGILCLSYHRLGDSLRRDSLFQELKTLNYENLANLEELIYN